MKIVLLTSAIAIITFACPPALCAQEKIDSQITAILFRYWDTDHLFGVARRSGPVDQEGMILTYLPGVETPLVENDLSLTH
ncbi:MAG: hypothetical protein RLY93_18370, partial [Sumerlaeia bacterium]